MPDIILKYKQKELEEFICDMLAVKGLRPKQRINFKPQLINDDVSTFEVIIECESGPLLNECPMCQARLHNGMPIVTPVKSSEKVYGPYGTIDMSPIERKREYTSPDLSQDVIVDSELGETFDPPSPNEGIPPVSRESESMMSVLEQNKQLLNKRKRELTDSHLLKESTKPPKL